MIWIAPGNPSDSILLAVLTVDTNPEGDVLASELVGRGVVVDSQSEIGNGVCVA